MNSDTFVTKLIIDERVVIYIKVSWKENQHELFHLKIYDGNKCWSGSFSNEHAAYYRESTDESEEEYGNNVKESLMNNNSMYIHSFVYTNSSKATFSWKKRFEDKAITLKHCSISVTLDDADSKDSLIDFLLDQNRSYKKDVEEHKQKIHILALEVEKCKAELETFVNNKTSFETSLYAKFMQLLNAKKDRILVLEERLQKYSNAANTDMD